MSIKSTGIPGGVAAEISGIKAAVAAIKTIEMIVVVVVIVVIVVRSGVVIKVRSTMTEYGLR